MTSSNGLLRTLEEQIDPAHAALLIVDVQNDFVHPDGLYGRMTSQAVEDDTSFYPRAGALWDVYPLVPRALENLRSLLAAAREANVFTVFVRAIYDPVYLSAPQRVIMERHGLYGTQCQAGTFGADFYEDIRPAEGAREVVVTKHRWSGFAGTDLDLVLRSNGIRTILLTGTATSICVESTARDGLFNDYYVVSVEDCCGDRGEDRQRHSMRMVEWAFGLVTSAAEVAAVWHDASGGRRRSGARA